MHTLSRGITPSQYELAFFDQEIPGERFPDRIIRNYTKPDYRLETWLLPGKHVLRFEHRGVHACELVSDDPFQSPSLKAAAQFPCSTEREFEHRLKGVMYMTTVVTENLAQNLFLATLEETLSCAQESAAPICTWQDSVGPCASVLEIQSHVDQIHVEAYHMIASQGLIVRTQSIFELVNVRKPALVN